MVKFTNFFVAFVILSFLTVFCNGDSTFLYANTRICSNSKRGFCLSFDKHRDLVILDKKHRMRFEIESIDGINMELNRVYTYAVDKATRKKVKSCLVKRDILDMGAMGLSLAPCDTDDNELVLAVSPAGGDKDEFLLRELGFLERDADSREALCLSMTFKQDDHLEISKVKDDIRSRMPVVLKKCADTVNVGQDFQARHFDREISERVSSDDPNKKQIGRFCLIDKPELCLGISLTNGTIFENNKFLQVKNHTKNEAKGLSDLKMEWYWDRNTGKIASAQDMDYCIEAIYNAPIGRNRPGIPQFDDILYLGACDPNRAVELSDEAFKGFPASENFYTKQVAHSNGGYVEIRTDVPLAARPTDATGTVAKCVSVVKCVRHDFDSCTKYNSVEVSDPKQLEQGAYVRLKDCDSANMASQRFYYTVVDDVSFPPTHSPTPPVVTAAPTPKPTDTPAPTPEPTTMPSAAPVETSNGFPPSPDDLPINNDKTGGSALTAGLAVIGVLCLAIIVAGVVYYFKHRGEFQELPEEDENFIARV